MTRSVDEFASRYDEWAVEYDDDYAGDGEGTTAYSTSVSLVVDAAAPRPDETVVDVGTGTGAVALELADVAETVVGRDVSEGMLERAREKAAERDIGNATFGVGRFREPNVEAADVVVSNWALHHLPPDGQLAAIESVAGLRPRRIVLGAAMYFEERDPADPLFSTDSVYPATVGQLVTLLTDAGFAVTDVQQVTRECGVLVADRTGAP